MTRQIPPEMLLRVQAIDWFAKCGEPLDLKLAYPVRQVANWKRAEVHWNKQSWEDTQGEASNIVTSYLGMNYPQDYADWNNLVNVAKQHMRDIFYPPIEAFAQHHSLPKSFISNVEWDVLGAIMEAAYLDLSPPVTFGLELLEVYEAGYMPCGWEHGAWPVGTLIVY